MSPADAVGVVFALEAALRELVETQDMKITAGKTPVYEQRHDAAWAKAKAVLKAYDELRDPPKICYVCGAPGEHWGPGGRYVCGKRECIPF
jgi:hypothetical protein